MNAVRRTLFLLALLAAASMSIGCDDDNDTDDTEDHDHAGGADDDHDEPSDSDDDHDQPSGGQKDAGAGDNECSSFETEHLKLLNAETDATVVKKKSAAPKLDEDN